MRQTYFPRLGKTLVTEMLRFYDYAVKEGFVLEVDALRYIVAYLSAQYQRQYHLLLYNWLRR